MNIFKQFPSAFTISKFLVFVEIISSGGEAIEISLDAKSPLLSLNLHPSAHADILIKATIGTQGGTRSFQKRGPRFFLYLMFDNSLQIKLSFQSSFSPHHYRGARALDPTPCIFASYVPPLYFIPIGRMTRVESGRWAEPRFIHQAAELPQEGRDAERQTTKTRGHRKLSGKDVCVASPLHNRFFQPLISLVISNAAVGNKGL